MPPQRQENGLYYPKSDGTGANSIIPVISERSVPKIEDKADKKTEHWQKIAKEAAEQSGRSSIPQIAPLSRFEDIIKTAKNYDLSLIPWEGETNNSLKTVLTDLTNQHNNRPNNILILIGPEGGFSKSEVDKASKAGFKSISLGKRILRTETAAIAMLAQIYYELE